ncbi:spermidine synthase [Patescibacteria group bacterium]
MFIGNKVIKVVNSKINGRIEVIKSLAFGTYITVGGLTQSGGIVYEIWKKTLKKVKRNNKSFKNVLILGLGGGSVSILVNKYWTDSKIVGVEIDAEMIQLGKKYLNTGNVDTRIEDAFLFCKKAFKEKMKFDLIMVDLYLGDRFPEKFDSLEFINLVKRLLTKQGLVIFNKLYYAEKRKNSLDFAKKVEKVFKNVEYYYPEANLMLICSE